MCMFFYSAALSVKMSILLYLPGLLVILFKRRGLLSTVRHLGTIVLTQTLLAVPFVHEDPWTYFQSSFDLSRVFQYRWTVNWRLLDEGTFMSPRWTSSLLIGHFSVLVAFGLLRWCRSDGSVWTVLERGFQRPSLPAGLVPLTGDCKLVSYLQYLVITQLGTDVATVLFTSNLIGILFARSLHYQFYSWYAQQIPFLTWKTRYPIVIQ
jgi:alpha-1,3-mannosyltransferase